MEAKKLIANALLGRSPARNALAVQLPPPREGILALYNPSARDRIGNALYDMLSGVGLRGTASSARKAATDTMDFVPVLGDVLAADDFNRAANSGDTLGSILAGGGLALGMVPVAGDIAGKALKKEGSDIVHSRAERLYRALMGRGIDVGMPRHSVNRFGESSSYISTKKGNIRVSDHPSNQKYRVEQAGEIIGKIDAARMNEAVSSIEAFLNAPAPKTPSRPRGDGSQAATEAAVRAAKDKFFLENGLQNSTETARTKAWKEHLRAQGYPENGT